LGLPQDLVDWLAPTLQVSNFLSGKKRAPDIFAVGFQELLPLHLGLAGLSKAVLDSRHSLILSQIEAHAPNNEPYSLVAKIANVGIALLVFARDDGIAKAITKVQTQWTGTGPAFMGNKGAVGIRFQASRCEDEPPETYTFVNCHLTPHDHKVQARIADWRHIVSTLLFDDPRSAAGTPSTLYDTSHLFVFGDMNFRMALPATHPLAPSRDVSQLTKALSSQHARAELKEYDQLTNEQRLGNVFVGLREGSFWNFQPSYKYVVGEIDKYSPRRTPSWTDRILYTTYADLADEPGVSSIRNLLYTSIPSYTTSDHKPVVALLLLPKASGNVSQTAIRRLQLPPSCIPAPDPRANLKKYTGRAIDRVVGLVWWLLTLLGAGSGVVGLVNFILGLGALTWWRRASILGGTNNV